MRITHRENPTLTALNGFFCLLAKRYDETRSVNFDVNYVVLKIEGLRDALNLLWQAPRRGPLLACGNLGVVSHVFDPEKLSQFTYCPSLIHNLDLPKLDAQVEVSVVNFIRGQIRLLVDQISKGYVKLHGFIGAPQLLHEWPNLVSLDYIKPESFRHEGYRELSFAVFVDRVKFWDPEFKTTIVQLHTGLVLID